MDARIKSYQTQTEQSARDQLILDHLYFVRNVIGRILGGLPGTVDKENLEAAGILGLVEAANRFSADRGVDFKSYAFQRIRGAVYDELRRNCPLPQKVLDHWSLIRDAIQNAPHPLSSADLSRITELKLTDVETCLAAIRMTSPESWQDELYQPSQTNHDSIDRHELLVQAIEKLPQRLREVLTLYHLDNLTLRQIGEIVGLSESRVSRLLAEAELLLKQKLPNLDTA